MRLEYPKVRTVASKGRSMRRMDQNNLAGTHAWREGTISMPRAVASGQRDSKEREKNHARTQTVAKAELLEACEARKLISKKNRDGRFGVGGV